MSFLSKNFPKGTIIESTECIHIETKKKKGFHRGVVDESNNKETRFHIFTHSTGGNNKLVDFTKFSNDFGKKKLDDKTYITEAIFQNKTKNIKRPKGGGSYNV